MRNWVVAALAVAVVGLGGYLLFMPRDKPQQTKARGGHGRTVSRRGAGGVPDEVKGVELHGGMGGGVLKGDTAPKKVPISMVGQQTKGPAEYKSAQSGLRVKKPLGPEWVMADDPARFLIGQPGKLVEMHRNPGRADPRFATIYVYALQAVGNSDGGKEVAELERLDKKAPLDEFKVEEEQQVRVNGERMIRRISRWTAEGRETKFISVRCIKGRTLYVLIAFSDPTNFDAFLPEFETVINSLEIG